MWTEGQTGQRVHARMRSTSLVSPSGWSSSLFLSVLSGRWERSVARARVAGRLSFTSLLCSWEAKRNRRPRTRKWEKRNGLRPAASTKSQRQRRHTPHTPTSTTARSLCLACWRRCVSVCVRLCQAFNSAPRATRPQHVEKEIKVKGLNCGRARVC